MPMQPKQISLPVKGKYLAYPGVLDASEGPYLHVFAVADPFRCINIREFRVKVIEVVATNTIVVKLGTLASDAKFATLTIPNDAAAATIYSRLLGSLAMTTTRVEANDEIVMTVADRDGTGTIIASVILEVRAAKDGRDFSEVLATQDL